MKKTHMLRCRSIASLRRTVSTPPLVDFSRVSLWIFLSSLQEAFFSTLLVATFRGWHKPIPELIEATAESVIIESMIYDRRPFKRWSEQRVTLLGDAAHPMTPDLGQGACQALEDAAVLTRCLEKANDPASALRRYESRRIRRANSFVLASQWVGRMFQLEGDLACRARDRFLRSPLYHRLQLNGLRRLAEFAP